MIKCSVNSQICLFNEDDRNLPTKDLLNQGGWLGGSGERLFRVALRVENQLS